MIILVFQVGKQILRKLTLKVGLGIQKWDSEPDPDKDNYQGRAIF